jgi:hypothetical protein
MQSLPVQNPGYDYDKVDMYRYHMSPSSPVTLRHDVILCICIARYALLMSGYQQQNAVYVRVISLLTCILYVLTHVAALCLNISRLKCAF